MKSKLIRQTASLILAATMVMSSAMYASASSGDGSPGSSGDVTSGDVTSGSYSITITDDHRSAGTVYKAYQIFTGKPKDDKKTLTGIKWGKDINHEGLVAELIKDSEKFEELIDKTGTGNLFKTGVTAPEVAAILADNSGNAEFVKLFAAYVDKNIKTPGTEEVGKKLEWDDAVEAYTADGFEAGYYLIKDETKGASGYVLSSYILKVTNDEEVEAKHSMPTIEKEIIKEDGEDTVKKDGGDNSDAGSEKTADGVPAIVAGIGDTVTYQLKGTLPSNYGDFEHFYYQFTDVIPAGLDLDKKEGAIKIKCGGEAEVVLSTSDTADEYYRVVENPKTGETTLTVIVKDLKKHTTLDENSKIVVTYNCTVNSDAGIYADKWSTGEKKDKFDNVNIAKITFSNNPYSDYNGSGDTTGTTTTDTNRDAADVFVLRLNIHKQNDSAQALKDVKFTISRKNAETNKDEYAVVKTGTTYTIESWTDKEDEATQFTTNEDGNIVIDGLDDDTTYTISEVAAPDGYTKVDDFTITLKATAAESGTFTLTVDGVTWTPTGDDHIKAIIDTVGEDTDKKTTGSVTVVVTNDKDSKLPETGGSGVYFYYAVGGGLVVIAVSALVLTRKKKKS